MAYTVGSASVEIVPDFRNAQLAITAFFAKQGNEVKIPFRPEMDRNAVQDVEREARQTGNRVGKALSDGASKGIDRTVVEGLSKEITKLEADIARSRNAEGHATSALQRAEDRLREARNAGNRSASQMLSLEQAVERAQIKLGEAQRNTAQSTDRLSESRRRLALMTQQLAADAAGRSLAAQQRADEASARSAIRTAERIAAERNRILQQEIRERARTEERYAREEEKRLRDVYKQAAKEAQQAFKESEKARIQVEVDEKQARDAGRETGGIVTRSINHEIHQNAGLIAGALAAAFAVGAPAFIGAASGLFAGVGALLVAQSEEVRSSWLGMFQQVTTNAEADASVLIGTFQRLSTTIGNTFQRLRPQITQAFEAVGPQVDIFADALSRTAENALPGLVAAVKAAGPVVQGLGTFMEHFGTGFSNFFDILATHAPAAGTAFGELGRSFEALLPTLAELLGQGAELASVVLPVLTSSFGGLNFVVNALGGALPVLGSAFLAFRSVQGVGRVMQNLSRDFGMASISGGVFAGAAGKAAGALTAAGKAVPVVGVAAALLGSVFAESAQKTNDWAEALNEGGDAAERANVQISHNLDTFKNGEGKVTWWSGFIGQFHDSIALAAHETAAAREKNEEYLASLTPLEAANRNLDIATRALAKGQGDQSVSAGELAKLQSDVANASAEAAREQENLEAATEGVTTAMAEQADQARSLVDAQFGYEKAVRKARDAQDDYNTAVKESGANSQEATDALEVFNEALLKQVDAAAKVATSELPASMTDNQKAILGAKGALDELNAIIASGIDIPPEMEAYRQRLEQITGQADGAALAQAELAQAVGNLGFTVDSLPGTKKIEIQAPTEELKTKLDDLGFDIETLPNGDIQVEANTDEAIGNLGNLTALLAALDAANPEPDVGINDNAFTQTYNELQRNVDRLDGERPTPVANIDDKPFVSAHARDMAKARELDKQTPTPKAGLYDKDFATRYLNAMSATHNLDKQRPNPVLSATDHAIPLINSVFAALQQLRDKTIRINTIQTLTYQTIGRPPGSMGGPQAATGGSVEDIFARAPRYDGGGATFGRGGPLDDLNTIRVSPGEHMLDARDVSLMGGQAGVYAFRELLNSGRLGRPSSDSGARGLASAGAGRTTASGSTLRDVTILTSDNPRAIVRAIRADEQQQAALAAPW